MFYFGFLGSIRFFVLNLNIGNIHPDIKVSVAKKTQTKNKPKIPKTSSVPHLQLFSKCAVMNKPFTSAGIWSAGFQIQKN